MMLHRNAKLGPAGRFALVQALERGMSQRAAAAALSVSPATACRWWHRWCEAGEAERRSLACLHDRSSRPRRMPRLLSATAQRRICAARRRTGWGPRLLTLQVGHPRSTISKVLRRHGLSRPPRPRREPEHRYEWPCPGDLLHMDTSEYARFQRPGHRVTDDRSSQDRQRRDGVDVVHAIVDDHSRLAYAEIHDDQKAETVVAFLERALGFFAEHGTFCKRLMTDNGWSYVKSRKLRELLARRGIRHLTTEPYRPRTNGKVERFHQTMAREWAYGLLYQTDRERARALPHWLHHYNTARPHSSLGGQPPISRVHNLRRQDI
jgi:transposase InsO family protein